jgi:beta-phosphoglucomutase
MALFTEDLDIKAIIFDCDGVLVDSEHAHYISWVYALQHQGYDLSKEEYYAYVGNPTPINAQAFAKKIGKDCADALIRDKRATYYGHHIQNLNPIQPTVDFVKLVGPARKRLNLKLAVASAGTKRGILMHLQNLGIEQCFDVVLSGQDDLTEYHDSEGINKPKPYIYLHAAKMLGVQPAQCLVFEDSNTGIMAAVTAGCKTITIPNPYTQRQDLSRAWMRIDSLAEIDVDQFFKMLEKQSISRR